MLYQNKYRVESTRYKNWNYSNEGLYFVTICVKDMKPSLGAINYGKIVLSSIGEYAKKCWEDIVDYFQIVRLDEYIIMPNRIHGIIEITDNNSDPSETQGVASLHRIPDRNPGRFGPQSANLSSIIRGFKSGVTVRVKSEGIPFQWQPRYYDYIISREKELNNIREYIRSNPANWGKDKYYQGLRKHAIC